MALRGKVVDFVRLDRLEDPHDAARIGHVAVMQDEATIGYVGILIEMVDALGIEKRRAPFHAVDHIPFVQQQLGQVSAVLAGDSGNQCSAVHWLPSFGSSISAARWNS